MRSKKKCYLVLATDGLVLLDEDVRILKTIGLPEEPRSAASVLRSLSQGRATPEFNRALEEAKGRKVLVVENEGLAKAVSESGWKGSVKVKFPSSGGRMLRRYLADPARRSSKWWETAREIASEKVRESYEDWDRLVVQAVAAIDELDRSMANLYARCREWYSIHFPELERIATNERLYTNLLIGSDPRMSSTPPEGAEVSEERWRRIMEAAEESVGVELGENDLEAIRQLARSIRYLDEKKSEIFQYLSSVMEENASSLTKVAEVGVAARLIARAGSMKKLALMPSTSVQTLGAEKALFRHITKGARPPKHGIIFQHPHVRNSPKGVRGKVASVLASKISLAARTDYITGVDKGDELKSSLDATVRHLRKKAS